MLYGRQSFSKSNPLIRCLSPCSRWMLHSMANKKSGKYWLYLDVKFSLSVPSLRSLACLNQPRMTVSSFSVESGKQPGPLGKGDLHVGGAPAVKLLQIHGESNLSQLSSDSRFALPLSASEKRFCELMCLLNEW